MSTLASAENNPFGKIRKVGFDTETTGVDPETAQIVTAALVAHGGSQPDQAFTWLINPGVPIPDEAADIHGITTERAQAEGQDPTAALDDIASKLTDAIRHEMPIVAFNMSFDWTVLDRDLRRHGLPTMDGRTPALVDPMVIDRRVDRYRKGSRKLGDVCAHYGITLKNWHTADADALAAILIAEVLMDRYVTVSTLTPGQLYEAQALWHREWAAGFETYLRKSDDTARVDGAWPLRPAPAEVTS